METRLLTVITLFAALIALPAAAKDTLVAHEWGTFTSVQGADGVQISWTPSIKTDLPDFVYSRSLRNGGVRGVALGGTGGGKDVISSLVRMETPVIYFYSPTERVVDVRVLFPLGRITEWYPQATNVGPYATTSAADMEHASRSLIEWKGVTILSPGTSDISMSTLIRDPAHPQANHYYAARDTDANFLRVASPHAGDKAEHERDLFYRGVGFFSAPLTATLDADERELMLSTQNAEPLTEVFVLTVRQGMMRYRQIGRVTAQDGFAVELDAQSFAALSDAREWIMRDVAAALTRQGLYAKEAQAMVDTWKDQWFTEEGTRVLYLLPRTWTDRMLPLEIAPRPHSVVRVMVGRAELITPSRERELRKQIVAFSSGDPSARRQAVAAVRRLGLRRFFAPAMQKVLGENPDQAFAQAAWALMAQASKLESETAKPRAIARRTEAERP